MGRGIRVRSGFTYMYLPEPFRRTRLGIRGHRGQIHYPNPVSTRISYSYINISADYCSGYITRWSTDSNSAEYTNAYTV